MSAHGMKTRTVNRFIINSSLIATFTFSLIALHQIYSRASKPTLELTSQDIEPVRTVRYDVTVNAPGEVQSANNTVVECEIERLAVYTQGRAMVSRGSTRILKLIPDGSHVKKGDVLALLDSRDFEEIVRLQKINLEQALAMQKYTEMDLEVSGIALQEYLKGSAVQTVKALQGQIAMATFDASRTTGRLEWSRKMFEKGYLSKTTVRAEELALQRSDLMLTRAQTALNTFQKFTLPKTEHSFQARIMSQTYLLKYYQRWVASQRERLEKFQNQVAKCTVRAPHDGMVIYANENDGDTRVEEGSEMRQGQDMFYLPDLHDMQVLVKLNESIVEKVEVGMPVNVLVQSLDQREYAGKVEKIAEFPIPPSSWRSSPEVKNYYCVVKIEGKPEDLRPGLTAEIKVMTGKARESLAVSPEVVHLEDDKEYCFVVGDGNHIEKREIRTRTADAGSLEILEGLTEGEMVLRSPGMVEDDAGLIDDVVRLNSDKPNDLAANPVIRMLIEQPYQPESTEVQPTSADVAGVVLTGKSVKDGL